MQQQHFRHYHYNNVVVGCILLGGYYITKWLGIIAFTYRNAEPRRTQCKQQRPQQSSCNTHRINHREKPHAQLHTHTSRVDFSRPLRYYSLAILLIITIAVPFVGRIMILNQDFLRNSKLLSLVGFGRFTFLHLCTVGTLFRQFCKQRELITCINRIIQLRHAISALANQIASEKYCGNHMALMLCLQLIPLLLSPTWTIFIMWMEYADKRPAYLAALLCLYYCQLVLQLTLCTYYVSCLILSQQSNQINQLLRSVLRQAAKHCVHPRPFNINRRYRCHTLTDALRRLQCMHEENSQISRILLRLYGPQLVAFFGFVLAECTVQFFVLYFVSCSRHVGSVQIWNSRLPHEKNGKEFCRMLLNPWAVLYVFGLLCHIFLLVGAAHQLQSRAQSTRVVLAEGSAQLPLPKDMCRRCRETQLPSTVSS
ncbi:putative gustatory receptor 77a [Anastrepha obliqua]|uniref:putative gustatory receptor 77a n=1 Tax=Anastrepha obliqua TaxID=95512 RepID=UPI00240A3D7E|nr:putative gustatory receptor 77a [Anastrepha obliqua]